MFLVHFNGVYKYIIHIIHSKCSQPISHWVVKSSTNTVLLQFRWLALGTNIHNLQSLLINISSSFTIIDLETHSVCL